MTREVYSNEKVVVGDPSNCWGDMQRMWKNGVFIGRPREEKKIYSTAAHEKAKSDKVVLYSIFYMLGAFLMATDVNVCTRTRNRREYANL